MMVELTPFGHPSGQVWPKDFSWPITIQSNFCKDQDNLKALIYRINYPSWYPLSHDVRNGTVLKHTFTMIRRTPVNSMHKPFPPFNLPRRQMKLVN